MSEREPISQDELFEKIEYYKNNFQRLYKQAQYFMDSDQVDSDIQMLEAMYLERKKMRRKHRILRLLMIVVTVLICIFF